MPFYLQRITVNILAMWMNNFRIVCLLPWLRPCNASLSAYGLEIDNHMYLNRLTIARQWKSPASCVSVEEIGGKFEWMPLYIKEEVRPTIQCPTFDSSQPILTFSRPLMLMEAKINNTALSVLFGWNDESLWSVISFCVDRCSCDIALFSNNPSGTREFAITHWPFSPFAS